MRLCPERKQATSRTDSSEAINASIATFSEKCTEPQIRFYTPKQFADVSMGRHIEAMLVSLFASLIALSGCQDLAPVDARSLLFPGLHRSEVFGFLAGFGTTFAALPDLIAMRRRRSSAGMNPRMAAIMGVFQILWIYYGLLIASRPVILWNVFAVLVNSLSVGAYFYFIRKEKGQAEE
jgi:MtN3 and saliva related transmembrane protein